jgi:hypothetical protein
MSDTRNQPVEQIGEYHWRKGDTDYRLTDIPSFECFECGYDVPDEEYCYFRDGPEATDGFDHICWDCGQEVTGFGE